MYRVSGARQSDPPPSVKLRLPEWTRLEPASEGPGRPLLGLRLSDDAHVRLLASNLERAGVVVITELLDGVRIETGSYVGHQVVGSHELTIVPKLAWQRWLALFGYALRLRGLVRTERAAMQVAPTSLHDLVVLELIAEARDLIVRGIHRDYVRRSKSLASPRGRVNFGRIARQGGIREAAVPCRFTERSANATLNQVLLAGLRCAAVVAREPTLRGDALRLANDMDRLVSERPLSGELLRSAWAALDRRTQRYAPALRLIQLLHDGQSFTLQDDPESKRVPLPGFAFDMNRLWQRLLGRVLRKWSNGLHVQEEHSLRGLFSRDSSYSPRPRRIPTPRPDYAVFRARRLVTFLDAKYRDLWEESLPREMLYQLALYSMAHTGHSAAMLYPTDAIEAAEERLEVRDPADGSVQATVALRPVHLGRLEALITAPPSVARERERSGFCRALIGVDIVR
jgi:5-methylcytosine-specific restriction enzyme subunit McrC